MPKSAKPRKKFRPKPMLVNPVGFVVESMTPLVEYESYVLHWKLRNTVAFGELLKGKASKTDIDTLASSRNIVEALLVTLKGVDIDGTLDRSAVALVDICDRANQGKGTATRAPELQAIRDLMSLHDELLDAVTVGEFEAALAYARKEIAAGKANKLKEPA
jgi:hypothetical protein